MTTLHPRPRANDVFYMHYGAHRRAEIIKTIESYEAGDLIGLPVNNKWMWNTTDPDIKYLLKKNKVTRFRVSPSRPGKCKSGKGQTYLVLVK